MGKKIIHYRQLYIDRPDPITFIPVVVDTSGHIYDDFLRLLFLHAHREASALANEIPEESGHFRFLYLYLASFALGDLQHSYLRDFSPLCST